VLVETVSATDHRNQCEEGGATMSSPVLHRMLVNALSLAEQHLRSEARIVPMLYFAGAGGEAVLRLDLTPETEADELRCKAQLMATALAAEACAWVFEAQVRAPGEAPRRVVAVLGEDGEGTAMTMLEMAPDGLTPIDTPLCDTGGCDQPWPLHRFVCRDAGDNDPLEAWRRLEAMGVNRSDSRRPLH
jgi:hypothetical protein